MAGRQPSRLTVSCHAPRLSAVTTLAATLNIFRSCTSSFSSSETFSSGWSKSMSNTPAMATLRSVPPVTERKNSRSPPPHGNTHVAAITGYYTGHAHYETPKRGGTLSALLLFWHQTSAVPGSPFPPVKGKKYPRYVKIMRHKNQNYEIQKSKLRDKNHNYGIQRRNSKIKSRNSKMKSQNYEMKSQNYEIKSQLQQLFGWDLLDVL